ncbi:hypothetical protein [Streptococcus urinalis]|nr:hypothetical protein [Streptococcus urinalis]
MLVYIFYMTFSIDGGMVWFNFYITNLLAFRFQDKIFSFKMETFILLNIAMIIYGIIWTDNMDSLMMIFLVPILNFSMLYFWRKEAESDRQKQLLLEKNESINLLLAENERN